MFDISGLIGKQVDCISTNTNHKTTGMVVGGLIGKSGGLHLIILGDEIETIPISSLEYKIKLSY